MYIIGMTGTRSGMNIKQKMMFKVLLQRMVAVQLHHGDCVGADDEAHTIAINLGTVCVIHPPLDPSLRAFRVALDIREPKGYFARNRDIVDESEVLIGLPATMFETGGGTWYTINYAKKVGKPIRIIYPDGTIEEIN